MTYNPFKGIGKAPVYGGGAYIEPGKHLLRIQSCKTVESQKTPGATMFIVEFEVVESNRDDWTPGDTRSWVVNLVHASSLSNVKGFLVAALDCTEAEIDDDVPAAVIHESQPLAGELIHCEAFLTKTKKGGDFTKCNWAYANAKSGASHYDLPETAA